jgi:DNA polymerase III delta prime subunit
MHNFYTSEILVLPKKVSALNSIDQLEEKNCLIKTIIDNYLLNEKHFPSTKNIVFFNTEYTSFPIEEVRNVQIEAGYSSSFSGQEPRVFILLNFDSASDAAQNAALKIIEESPQNTLILLLVTKKDKILETITSRCQSVQLEPILQSKEDKRPQKTINTLENFIWPKNYSQAVDLAQQNKDRACALDLIEELLKIKDLKIKQKQALLRTYQDLNRNQNVQLVLENCFFSLVSLES